MNDGTSYNDTYSREGQVHVSNLNCYFHKNNCSTRVTRHALSHIYGDMALAFDCGTYSDITNVINSQHDYQYYCRRDQKEFAYRFNEYNPSDVQQAYPHFTGCIMTAASGDCTEYDQVENPTPDKVGDMNALSFIYFFNGSFNGTIAIPKSSLGREGTTYIYRDINAPAGAFTYSCGARCILMWAYKNAGAPNGPKFYQCLVTVNTVSNVIQLVHNVPNSVAKLAVASIALQGQFHGPITKRIFTHYQFYASG